MLKITPARDTQMLSKLGTGIHRYVLWQFIFELALNRDVTYRVQRLQCLVVSVVRAVAWPIGWVGRRSTNERQYRIRCMRRSLLIDSLCRK